MRPFIISQSSATGVAGKAIAVAAYFFVLAWTMQGPLAIQFGYQGFGSELAMSDLALTFLMVMIPVFALPRLNDRPSAFIIHILYLITVIPSSLVAAASEQLDHWECRALQIILVSCTLLLCWLTSLPLRPIALNRWDPSPGLFWGGLFAWSVFFHSFLILRFRTGLNMVSFEDVYDVRATFFASGVPAAVAYLLIWQIYVITPALMLLGFHKRNASLIACTIFFQLLIYGMTGLKAVIFSVPMLFCCYLFFTNIRRGHCILIPLVLAIGCLFAHFHFVITDDILVYSFVVRRAIMLPGLLTIFYFRFFSDHPVALLGHSALGNWVKHPYDLAPSKLVGEAFFGRHDASANANIWADGFANFGILGMIGTTLVLALLLRTIDRTNHAQHKALRMSLLAMPTMALTNCALPTCLVTHGFGLMIILFYFWPPVPANANVKIPACDPIPKNHQRVNKAVQGRLSANSRQGLI